MSTTRELLSLFKNKEKVITDLPSARVWSTHKLITCIDTCIHAGLIDKVDEFYRSGGRPKKVLAELN